MSEYYGDINSPCINYSESNNENITETTTNNTIDNNTIDNDTINDITINNDAIDKNNILDYEKNVKLKVLANLSNTIEKLENEYYLLNNKNNKYNTLQRYIRINSLINVINNYIQ